MDYKATLNLPHCDFPMKADLPQREPEFIQKWNSEGLYQRWIKRNSGRPRYILHDGPPYANGHIHFGHILNKILKDIIVKYKNMVGFCAPYVPGWDCHGLPIELGAVKELAEVATDPAEKTSPLLRREACRSYAERYVKIQTEEFKRLGVLGDWENPYLTLSHSYEANIAREFVKLYVGGYIYQGEKPVHWCPSCKTALAEAEVEYENQTSPSIYVKFTLTDPSPFKRFTPASKGKKVSLVIWTTTPWTLPANLALAVGSEFRYGVYECDEEIFIVASDLRDSFLKAIGFIGKTRELAVFLGKDLIAMNLQCAHPFMKRNSPVLRGDHVTLESGTGIVHIAPGHGQEDFVLGQKNGLGVLCPIDEVGRIIPGSLEEAQFPEVRSWEGLFVKKANKEIIQFLFERRFLANDPGQNLTHSYPHCWRCKSAVIFRATKQWFCSLEHRDLRKRALAVIESGVEWIPQWGKDRISGMIEGRPDWCLSRQRIWGVPIIVHFCIHCKKPLLDEKIGKFIGQAFEREGADIWWKSQDPLLPPNTQCPCGSDKFSKEQSILDVWFDSGVSHAAVLETHPGLSCPADLYLEGSDQHRGWFHSSLLTSLATRGRAPYRAVLTHGFVVDGLGKKYSKSAKNYIPPDKVLKEMGAEILRMWVAAEDYRSDIRVSDEIMKVLTEVYRKMRNTCRFLLGNLYDFDAAKDRIPYHQRSEIDRYALHRLSEVVQRIRLAYDQFQFHIVHHTLNEFFTVDLSAFYLDILKDRLYCDRSNGFLRRSSQSTFYEILVTVVPIMSPILSFTAEEVWQFVPNRASLEGSVFLTPWPEVSPDWYSNVLAARWDRIHAVRTEVLKVLEGARKRKEIGHPLDAKVLLSAEGETLQFLMEYQNDWSQIFITSQVEIVERLAVNQLEEGKVPSLRIAIKSADGKKCQRCWNYSVEVEANMVHPTLCGRCVRVVT